jgi:hypothetical protein
MLQLGLIDSWHGAGLWMVLNMAAALLLGWFVGPLLVDVSNGPGNSMKIAADR